MATDSYWKKAERLKDRAIAHTMEMKATYPALIANSIIGTIQYRYEVKDKYEGERKAPEVKLLNADTVSAIMQLPANLHICVLNFASYNNPGGRFMDGSSAQEECLCHESTLYNVISSFPGFYEANNKDKNRGMYRNAALYSKDITFIRSRDITDYRTADVITCAAPNKSLCIKHNAFLPAENTKALRERIWFIKDIAEKHHPDVLILGAFGCGVFMQDPVDVAALFKEAFATTNIPQILYAVPHSKAFHENYKAFADAFGK